jgi:endonuclease G
MTVDDRVWKSSMGEHRIDWIANEGIRVAAILAHLNSLELTGERKNLRDQILEGSDVSDLPVPGPDPQPQTAGTPSTVGLQSTASAGQSVTLNIPLQVTLNLGDVQVTGSVSSAGQHRVSPAAPPDVDDVDFDDDDDFDEEEAVCVDPDYSNRKGYRADFLGRGERRVPLPELSETLTRKAAVNQEARGKNKYALPYHNYTVVMNKKRKLAIYAAVNIDGNQIQKVSRDRDKWYFDPRINRNEQVGAQVYKRNPLDKGHLVRRLDAAWGESEDLARVGSDDTFHYTNCAPQHKDFNRNRTTWAGLENYVLNNADVENLKVTVFNGPVFDEGDPPFRGVNLPREFWKIVVMVKKDRTLSATAYLLSQEALVQGLEEEFTYGEYKTFQVPVKRIEALTGLGFHHLTEHDPLAGDESSMLESTELHEIACFEDLVGF